MKKRIRKHLILSVFIALIIIGSTLSSQQTNKIESADPYFTLVAKTNGGGLRPDYLNFLKQHCARIGINIDVIVQDWSTFVGELIAFRDFDICYASFSGDGLDPDFTGIYNENGSLNLFGYHTSMDYNATLGAGVNEWYMRQGNLIMPSDGVDRIQHYWAWEQYLMDEILPCQPTFAPKVYTALWSNLDDYSLHDGLIQSWGKMSFDGPHTGQLDLTEVVTTDAAWTDLNPLFQNDDTSKAISSAILDKLIYYDADHSVHPHLADSYTFINDTYLRIEIREGIKWQNDPADKFTDEYLDAKDVYFTLYSWKHLSSDTSNFAWIEKMNIVNQFTLDIYIDGNPNTPTNEVFAPALADLSLMILPEHYLNQTQLVDGITPDYTHQNWYYFSTDCFGTSIFEFDSFTEGVETELAIFDDCWWLNASVDKTNMDFVNRFGDFTGGLDTWRIRIIPDSQTALLEFQAGKTDIQEVTQFIETREDMITDPDFDVQNETQFYFEFYGFNMRETRPVIGNHNPCAGDSSISIGLAVRKAISYALDRVEINDVIHRGEYTITNHPIYLKMGIWCNPNIIRYNHDLDTAREYLELIGNIPIPTPTPTPNTPPKNITETGNNSYVVGAPIAISILTTGSGIILIVIFKRRKKSE